MKKTLCAIIVFLVGCSPSPPENEEIQSWFENQYSSLIELAELGIKYKALRRAEPSLKEYTKYYGQPSEADLKAEARVFEIVEKLEIDFVAYWRNGLENNELLHSMSVPYYRWGLALGGYSKSIVYFPEYTSETKPPSDYSTYIYLNKQGWFIDVSDTR